MAGLIRAGGERGRNTEMVDGCMLRFKSSCLSEITEADKRAVEMIGR